ncbi:hypothetical protein D3C76_1628630 [compost metagenome]
MINLIRNRHLHTQLERNCISCFGSTNTFDYHPHGFQHLGQRLALTKHGPSAPVTAVLTSSRHNKVANSGKAGKGQRIGSKLNSHPRYLGESTGQKRCFSIVPISKAIG